MRLQTILLLGACCWSLAIQAQTSTSTETGSQATPKAATQTQTQAPVPKSASNAKAKAAPNAAASTTRAAIPNDRLDLETTTVSGNRELPKVLYIVPWKKSELGELPAQPFNTLLDEVLAPVDRDVFKREVKYFHAVNADSAASGTESGHSGKN